MEFFASIGGIITMVLAAFIFVGIVWLIWRRALLDIQSKAMEVQQKAIEAYESRVSQLETGQKTSELEIKRLEGVVQGKDIALKILIDSIAKTDRCMNAPHCTNRIIPVIALS